MTPKTFVERVARTVIDDGVKSYRQALADPGVVTDPYWKRLLGLYRRLSPQDRRLLLEIMRQVEIDTVSEMFGILDGASSLAGRSEQFELLYRGRKAKVRLNGDLQDLFLEKTSG